MKKVAIYILSTLVLGALGSGLWEIALKPVFASLYGVGLSIVTLGLDSLKDELYAAAAQRNHAYPAITLLSIVAGTALGIFTIDLIKVVKDRRSRRSSETTNPDQPNSRRTIRRSLVPVLVMLYMATYLFFISFRAWYISGIATNFDRMYDVVAPYVSEEERLLLKSKFARIRGREDYISVTDELQRFATERAKLPRFNIWYF
ncbi:Uncharacterised protein [Achromobacter spanius]|uniref:hypothetical protein n=1 Tax=Achromobacter spanius TaxID=217203 RepID=UPI000C2B9ED4|nr:hypothetical protein [Achromobacter spanius]AUA56290.1 hypothetical protein CVS48_09720 [Achromobacter spanius]CAB3689414.1 hypothetical protein LMG5911_04401 [Achromobacter spanius]SPT39246.1 Uncharacterised protein [Achromobacter denitrificans]VEE56152.1 Uncharacterised protein [Achromobacter spanius]